MNMKFTVFIYKKFYESIVNVHNIPLHLLLYCELPHSII